MRSQRRLRGGRVLRRTLPATAERLGRGPRFRPFPPGDPTASGWHPHRRGHSTQQPPAALPPARCEADILRRSCRCPEHRSPLPRRPSRVRLPPAIAATRNDPVVGPQRSSSTAVRDGPADPHTSSTRLSSARSPWTKFSRHSSGDASALDRFVQLFTRRVRGWRGARRVRCVLRRFRSSAQSGSHRSVSTPLLVEPDVRISRIRLSAGIMTSPTEGLGASFQGASGRRCPAAMCRKTARSLPTAPCAPASTTVAAAGSRAGPRPGRPG